MHIIMGKKIDSENLKIKKLRKSKNYGSLALATGKKVKQLKLGVVS